ncbi:S-layer homology domain-containing protein [Paenibacillus sp. YPG26]|uniref:S-layer homology domain-containing protein n=1 Tax=Paenibacillus sp. YPG26 TaxID=2878915 RepID=UPI00203BC768|nr:S-layer homology domain-containing protein [Paenibacillus sp. YPG26]USB31970.1 S-layer homology domain-containing protein [Paenibacillus sp. YPG26]
MGSKKVWKAFTAGMTGIIAAGCILGAAESVVSAEGAVNFKDKLPAWAKPDIEYAAAKGYMKGDERGKFNPNATISRAEFAAILARASSNPSDAGITGFGNIPGWSQDEVNMAVSKGFISPGDYPNGFNPNIPLTRRELAKWVASGLAAKDADFKKALSDTADTLVPVAEYYKGGLNKADYPYVSVALGTGLMGGYPDGRFGPAQTTTRAEAAVILRRFESIQGKKPDAFQDLKEFREVGLTGTNAISLGFEYAKDNGVEESFKKIRNVSTQLKNNIATIKLNRFILVNASKATDVKNLYGRMFVDKDYGTAFKMKKDRYEVFVEYAFTSNIDNMDVMTYLNSSSSPFLHLVGFKSGTISKFGIKTMPYLMGLVDKEHFFKKGIEVTFWGNGFILSNLPISDKDNGVSITVSGGKTFSIYKLD